MALFLARPPGAAAQADTAAADTARVTILDTEASPLLPPGHWAVRAAERLEGMGLAPSWFPAQGAVPRAAVFWALFEAAHPPDGGRGGPLAQGWLARFREEFSEYGWPRGHVSRLGAQVGGGYAEIAGVLSPATGYEDERQEPRPVADRAGAFGRAAGGVRLGRAAFAAGEAVFWDGEVQAPRWEVAAAARGWQLSLGRAEVRYGPGRGGGLILSPREALPRVELQRTRPLRLPGFLGHAGGVTGHLFVTRMDRERHPTEPWMFGARLAVRPHGRLTLGLNRAAIFGGEGRPLTLRNLAGMAVGVIRSDFENQVLAFDARWRLPTDALLPATAYAEYGADDGAGALDEQPAWIAGLSLPALPGAPQVALGVEAARFAGCCGHGAWYFHAGFSGNWARGEQALGHPLGGEGWERAAYASADLLQGRLRLAGRAYRRQREERSLAEVGGGNLFSSRRTGESRGGEVEAALRLGGRAEARAAWARESGDGWREQALHLALSAFF